jgi:anti-repressor protein
MNELIPVKENEQGNMLVSGRDLHKFLEIKTAYKDWFPRMCEYGFVEGADFCSFLSESTGGRPSVDHQISIDMAKEISMLQRNEKGKMARQYFLELERRWNSPEMVMKRAYDYLNQRVAALQTKTLVLEQQVHELKPKADYTDIILKNKGLVTITQIAKDYGMSAKEMNDILHDLKIQYKQSGQWLLYSRYHDKGYTHSETVDIVRKDGTPDIKMNTKWTQKGRLFIYDLLKKNGILPVIERNEAS